MKKLFITCIALLLLCGCGGKTKTYELQAIRLNQGYQNGELYSKEAMGMDGTIIVNESKKTFEIEITMDGEQWAKSVCSYKQDDDYYNLDCENIKRSVFANLNDVAMNLFIILEEVDPTDMSKNTIGQFVFVEEE